MRFSPLLLSNPMAHFNKYSFRGQRASEEILSVIHRHWFDIVQHFFILFVFLFALIGSLSFLPVLFPELRSGTGATVFLFAESLGLLFLWIFGFLLWVDYYLDLWIITNERVINIEQRGFFVRHVSELDFVKIQDVTSAVEGIIPTFLNFGDVHVQTAGEETRFVFRNVPDPYHIKGVVMQLCHTNRRNNIAQLERLIKTG